MIAVDTHILVYAHFRSFAKHEKARQRLTRLAEGGERWAIPVFCLGEFIRVTTHPKILRDRFSTDDACEALRRLTASPSLTILHPGSRFLPLLLAAVAEGGAAGNLAFDAQIVAVCREAGARSLLTEDRDYARFRGFHTARL